MRLLVGRRGAPEDASRARGDRGQTCVQAPGVVPRDSTVLRRWEVSPLGRLSVHTWSPETWVGTWKERHELTVASTAVPSLPSRRAAWSPGGPHCR